MVYRLAVRRFSPNRERACVAQSPIVKVSTAAALAVSAVAISVGSGGSPPVDAAACSIGTQTLRHRSSGAAVNCLERTLQAKGFQSSYIDTFFGTITISSVKRYQRANGLYVDGVVGAQTGRSLGIWGGTVSSPPASGSTPSPTPTSSPSACAITRTLRPLERNCQVRTLERLLQTKGYQSSYIDDYYGTITVTAVKAVQREFGLSVNGVADSNVIRALEGEISAPAPAPPASGGTTASDFQLAVLPVQSGRCSWSNTWHAPRSGGRLHVGADIMASIGTPVHASADGEITKINVNALLSGNGLRVEEPDGTFYLYLHLNSFAQGIGLGSSVREGQIIGYVGNTGASSSPHLHFEIHPQGGPAIDPHPALTRLDPDRNC
jgi:murein DD-endopeptidase MepM/ murein hydrolase activator NlpD